MEKEDNINISIRTRGTQDFIPSLASTVAARGR